MRDLVVREALRTLAGDAATLYRELVVQGAEIPYDVSGPENGSPLVQYVPRTDAFVRQHAGRLRALDSFGSAAGVLESGGLAAPYLEEAGVPVPPDDLKRGELACVVFLCRLWADSTDFSLDGERMTDAIAAIEALGEAKEGELEVFVAIRGLSLPVSRVDLPEVTLVRSDTVDVPPEARRSEGAPVWQPQFLAALRVDASEHHEDPADADTDAEQRELSAEARAVEAFRDLVTTLRLFRSGSVSLGPYAWTRVAGDRWRRISTGAGRARGGEYRLSEPEIGELTDFARKITARPSRTRTLRRAIDRFEAGLERQSVLDALNDHLLCLRFLLEGAGPAGLGLEMRVAALCAEPDEREPVRTTLRRAMSLERELWSGEPAAMGGGSAADVAGEVEDLTRAILSDSVAGHLGTDLRATADEILLADGLASGDGAGREMGGTAEWGVVSPETGEAVEAGEAFEAPGASEAPETSELPEAPARGRQDFPTDARITISHAHDQPAEPEESEEESVIASVRRQTSRTPEPPRARLRAVADHRDDHHEHGRPPRGELSERISYLFPRPEPCDWGIAELEYDRRRRQGSGQAV